MTHRIVGIADARGDDAAARLRAAGTGAVVAGARRARRRRVAGTALAVAVAVPLAAAAGWLVVDGVLDKVDPAREPQMEIRLDEPLEPQLQEAIAAGDHAAMEALLELGVYPRHVPEDGLMFTQSAAAECDVEALRILDEAGADRVLYEIADGDFDVTLRPVLLGCDPDTVRYVLDSTPLELDRAEVMEVAVHAGNAEVVRMLARAGYPTEVAGAWSALEEFALRSDPGTVATLLSEGADPSYERLGVPLWRWADEDEDLARDVRALLRAAAGR